ncbi:MAG: polysaccharide biosynthesis tyrosine autokinase [Candidatus Omnitrophota bacterium]|nr:MAG: polysaccharide biosynthesis tyrosine autokinase [Candidatus Omnitrophota bacterium]
MIPPPEVKELTIIDYLEIVLKRLWLVIACVGIIGGFVAYYDFSSVKIYQTRATLYIKSQMTKVTGEEEKIYDVGIPDRQTQMILLTSQSLSDRVIKSLDLLKDPGFRNAKYPSRKLRNMVKIRGVGKTDIVEVKVQGRDPLKITRIANTWVEEAIAEDLQRKFGVTKEGIKWLQKQMDEALVKLKRAEEKLNEFIKKNRLITIPDIGIKTESLIEGLKLQKSNLEREIMEASRIYKGKHAKIMTLLRQLDAVNEKLEEETDKMYALQEKGVEYKLLRQEAENYEAAYESFRDRIQELDISQELLTSNIQLVDEAIIPTKPIKPNPKKDILMGLMAGFVLGVGLSYFLEYMDSTLKTSEDVEFYTKMPFLGYVPVILKEVDKKDVGLVTHLKPYSQVAESFRNLRVSLVFSSSEEKALRNIVVTSTTPQEGKSFVAANLAISCAAAKEPTLLIDADMRKGILNELFKIKTKKGLTGVLAGMYSWDEAVVDTPVSSLQLLPCGAFSPNPTALLNTEKLKGMFKQMEEKYKRIIIDSPPILSVADSVILGGESSGVVFVIKAKEAPLNRILEAKKILGKKVNIVGAILNGAEIKKDSYYYYHYYHTSPEKKSG